MSAFKGPSTTKQGGGLGRRNPSTDMIFGLVAGGVAVSGYTVGDIVKLLSTDDAEALGIDAAYDSTNGILVYHHISEFFRLNPNGTFYLKLVAQGTSMTDMVDTNNNYLRDLLENEDTNGEIKYAGVVLNPVMDSPITALAIDTAGTGYQVGDAIVADDGGGSGFDAEVATVGGSGEITGITINNNGSGYTSLPTSFTVTTSGGSNATFTATLGNLYAPTLTDGLDNDVNTAIPKAQELLDDLRAEHKYFDGILIEGRQVNGLLNDLKDLRALTASQVSVVIAQDPAIVALNVRYKDYAAVGSVLGMLSVRKVNESLGSVNIVRKPEVRAGDPDYRLNDEANGLWLTAALSNGTKVSTLNSTTQGDLEKKGYIFAGRYEGYPGIYFNDGPTCIELANDFAYIENNRTWNKAARYVRTALIPKMKGEIDVDATTGYIAATTITAWKTSAEKETNKMLVDDEVSAMDLYIDPKKNVLAGEEIQVKVEPTPKGVARKISAIIGFKNPFNA